MTEPLDFVVVGGGIVGASTAHHLLRARPGASLLLLDKEPTFGVHQTGHNSGVIHSGIYYEPGSLKAEMCRRGARLTEEFAAAHDIPVVRTGKLLVATEDRELGGLARLRDRAAVNGIEAEQLDASELRRREPHVRGLAALWLPGTGITDYRRINQALAAEVAAARRRAPHRDPRHRGDRDRRRGAVGDHVGGDPGPARGLLRRASRPTGWPGWRASTWTSRSCRSAGSTTTSCPPGPTWSPR